MYQDDPDSLYDGSNMTGYSYLATLSNGPCAGYVVEAMSDCQILCVPYGDGMEMYRVDALGQWWHAPTYQEDAA